MSVVNQIRDLKRKLKKTWTSFFGRYGKLNLIQLKTIPVVLKGENAIIISPMASGKTEAVIAPIVENMLKKQLKDLFTLYISPTRALVNDMYYRLKDPLEELGVSITVKTGDKPQFNPKKPSNFLLTTPESLDSLICRHRSVLASIRVVILDEIHLIDNTYRGDQLRILLRRLREVVPRKISFYALSATVKNGEKVAGRYFHDFKVIKAEDKREIVYTFVESLKNVLQLSKEEKIKKLLIFCNKRATVERIAMEAKGLWGPSNVVVHHGSLDKSVREEAEVFMREAP